MKSCKGKYITSYLFVEASMLNELKRTNKYNPRKNYVHNDIYENTYVSAGLQILSDDYIVVKMYCCIKNIYEAWMVPTSNCSKISTQFRTSFDYMLKLKEFSVVPKVKVV
jgi:hypothetical protein